MNHRGHAALEIVFVAPLLFLISLVFIGIAMLAVRQYALHQAARDVVHLLAHTPELSEADMQHIAQEKLARRLARPISIKVHLRSLPVSVSVAPERIRPRVDIVELWVEHDMIFPGVDRPFSITAAVREVRAL